MPAKVKSQEFHQLQEAHDGLTAAYVYAHNEAGEKFWARAVVDDHLRRRLKALRDAFIQARETKFRSESQQKWLEQQADDLTGLEATFNRRWDTGKYAGGVTAVFGLPGVVAGLSATGVSAAVLAILQACLCHLLVLVPMSFSVALFLTFAQGFYDKRRLFLDADTGVEGGVYGVEDRVFFLLGAHKGRERQLDVIGWFLITVVWAAAAIIEESAIRKGLFLNPFHWLLGLYAGLAAIIAVAVALHSRGRVPA